MKTSQQVPIVTGTIRVINNNATLQAHNRPDEDLDSTSDEDDAGDTEKILGNDVDDLENEELSGTCGSDTESESIGSSETDEDEDEGLGDGNIGRSGGT